MNEIINIPKHYKNTYESETFLVKDKEIYLPKYVAASISKYRFCIENETIFLQRYCNACNTYFNVQKYDTNKFINIENNFRFIGKKSGFDNTCNNCRTTQSLRTASEFNDNLTQLNIKINPDLKKYYQILSIKKEISLQDLITEVLLSYKKNLKIKNSEKDII